MGFLKSILRSKPDQRPHDDPALESELPAAVDGRPLERWSVRGERAFTLGAYELKDQDRADIEDDLHPDGLTIDDVSMAFAGRAALSDPPYSVRVWRFGDRPATELPLDVGLEGKGMGGWQARVIGNHNVRRGTSEMIEQTRSARGRPYVVQSGPLHFSIVTEDEGWAEEVCRALAGPIASSPDSGLRLTGPEPIVEDAIERLAAGEADFAVFEVPGGRNIYAQVVIGDIVGEPLHGELVGNRYLELADQLDDATKERLISAGWNPMGIDDNFAREWTAWSADSDRAAVAREILEGLAAFGPTPTTLWTEIGSR